MASNRRGAQPRRGSRRASPTRIRLSALRVAFATVAFLVFAGAAFAFARETSVFAVRTIEVSGGSPALKKQVRHALAPELGRSLVALGGSDVSRLVDPLPGVVSARFDRAFPHTLHVTVRPERAVLLVRQGRSSWVVSSRGRVMRALRDPHRSRLPRLWLRKNVSVKVGETLPASDGRYAAAAVAPIAPGVFHGGVRTVLSHDTELTLVLGSGMQIRLGDLGDLGLKLTIARRILRLASAGGDRPHSGYVDVSVPERAVLGGVNSQVAGTA